jgi:bilirubin oxidase
VVHPDETVAVLAHFTDCADPEHPFMYHCHILEHEDRGMMGQFVVVA